MTALMINVFGGLAIFIFGMKMMSDGLHRAAGEKMRTILRFFAGNRFVAILSGTVVTAVIQSSSASTVMVIGFVNAGLLNLVQAIGIIFGANIGTTVTAQLVAFEIGWIIMPAIILGLLLGFINKPGWQGWGETVIGFGFLFLGMSVMSNELKVLSDHPGFMAVFQTFDCAPRDGWIPPGPLFGAIGIGLAATLIIQSSSACSGVVIALGAGGLLNLYTAVALVLGSNIGTTITAQLAAIPANRIAKQAALAHTLFNVIGVLVMVSTFWLKLGGDTPVFFQLVNWISDGGDLPRRIANAHTIFNVCTTVVLVPFVPLLARICEKVIPVREGKVKFLTLEPNLLETPSIALDQTVVTLRRMLKKAWRMVDCALQCCDRKNGVKLDTVRSLAQQENRIDEYQRGITDYLSQLMRRELNPNQAETIPLLIHCTNDAERIGDHTEKIVELVREFRENHGELSDPASAEISELCGMLSRQAECALNLLEHYSRPVEMAAESLEKEILDTADRFEANHMRRLARGKCVAVTGVFYIEMLAEITKVSRHLANIAERAGEIHRLLTGPLTEGGGR